MMNKNNTITLTGTITEDSPTSIAELLNPDLRGVKLEIDKDDLISTLLGTLSKEREVKKPKRLNSKDLRNLPLDTCLVVKASNWDHPEIHYLHQTFKNGTATLKRFRNGSVFRLLPDFEDSYEVTVFNGEISL